MGRESSFRVRVHIYSWKITRVYISRTIIKRRIRERWNRRAKDLYSTMIPRLLIHLIINDLSRYQRHTKAGHALNRPGSSILNFDHFAHKHGTGWIDRCIYGLIGWRWFDPIKLRKSCNFNEDRGSSVAVHAPFYKASERTPRQRKTFLIRGTRKFFASRRRYFFVVIGRLGCTHPSQWRHPSAPPTLVRARARARAIRLRHAKRSTTARTWIVFVFLFLPCSPVSQVHSRVQTRRDETRLFSNEPLLPRLPIADSKIDPPFPEGGGRIRIGAKDDELDEDGRGTVSSFSLLWDQIWLGLWLRNLELISSFFFILESFSFGFILIFERQIRG